MGYSWRKRQLVIKEAVNWVDRHPNYSQIQLASPGNIPNLGIFFRVSFVFLAVHSCTVASCTGNCASRSIRGLGSEAAAAKTSDMCPKLPKEKAALGLCKCPTDLPGCCCCASCRHPLWLGWGRRGCVPWTLHPGRVWSHIPHTSGLQVGRVGSGSWPASCWNPCRDRGCREGSLSCLFLEHQHTSSWCKTLAQPLEYKVWV